MQMYLGGEALRTRYPRVRLTRCATRGCKATASFVLAGIAGIKAGAQQCLQHVRAAAARHAAPVIECAEQLSAREATNAPAPRADGTADAGPHPGAARLASGEVLAPDAQGRTLCASGLRGKLFESTDGSFECELAGGTRLAPCCRLEGLRMAGVQLPAKQLRGHEACCPGG